MSHFSDLQKEAEEFDEHSMARIERGFVPDLRNLQTTEWFYNNPWREPEFAKIQWFPTIFSMINKCLEGGERVLEVGCGNGMISLEMARNGLEVTGVDLSPKSIQVANLYKEKNIHLEKFGSLNYICNDFLTLDFPEQSFDNVVFFRSLHHFPDVQAVVNESHRLLAENGNILVCEPIRGNLDKKTAEFSLILRTILPTWEDSVEKLNCEWSTEKWDEKVDKIYQELKYEDDHYQSVMDNSTNSDSELLKAFEGIFIEELLEYHCAFIDNLIGGLRGDQRYELARFLKFIDQHLVQNKVLSPLSMTFFGKKTAKP